MRKNKIKKCIAICFTFFLAIIGLINCKTYAYETNDKFTNTITSLNYQNDYTYTGNELTNLSSLQVNATEWILIQFNNNDNINWSDFVILINTEIKNNNNENATGGYSIQNQVGWNGTTPNNQNTIGFVLTNTSYNENNITTLMLKRSTTQYGNSNFNTLRITIPSGTNWKIYNIDILPASEIYTEYAMSTYTQQYIEQIERLTQEKEELEEQITDLEIENNELLDEKSLLQAEIDNLYNINEEYNNVLPFQNENLTNTTISVNGNIIPANQTELYDTTDLKGNQISVSSDFDLLPNINTSGANYIVYDWQFSRRFIINTYIIFGQFSDFTHNEMQLVFYDNNYETYTMTYRFINAGEESEWRNNVPITFNRIQLKLDFPEYEQIHEQHNLEYGFTLGGTYEQGYQLGLENGIQVGYENGLNFNRANYDNTIRALNERITNLQEQISNNFGWKQFFFGLVDIPFATLSNVLGFELFGVNLFYAMIGILTTLIIIWLVKKFI